MDLQGRRFSFLLFFVGPGGGAGEYRFEKERRRSAQPARYGHLVLNPAPAARLRRFCGRSLRGGGGGGGGRKKTLYRVCVSVSAALLGTHLHC